MFALVFLSPLVQANSNAPTRLISVVVHSLAKSDLYFCVSFQSKIKGVQGGTEGGGEVQVS